MHWHRAWAFTHTLDCGPALAMEEIVFLPKDPTMLENFAVCMENNFERHHIQRIDHYLLSYSRNTHTHTHWPPHRWEPWPWRHWDHSALEGRRSQPLWPAPDTPVPPHSRCERPQLSAQPLRKDMNTHRIFKIACHMYTHLCIPHENACHCSQSSFYPANPLHTHIQ